MIIPRVLASKIEEHGAAQVLKVIRSWERRKERDKVRYELRKSQLASLSRK